MKTVDFLLLPLTIIKGIGSKTLDMYAKLLNKNNPNVLDLLLHKPEKIIFRRENPSLMNVQSGEIITADVFVDEIIEAKGKNQPLKIRCSNDTGFLYLTYFKVFPGFLEKNFPIGKKIFVAGKVERFYGNGLYMSHPELYKSSTFGYEVVYPLTAGLNNRFLAQSINNALEKLTELPEWLNDNFLFEKSWVSWFESVKKIHTTSKAEDFDFSSPYIKRLAFDELLSNQIALGVIREKIRNIGNKDLLTKDGKDLKEIFFKKLPFELTGDQKKVINEIEKDIFSSKRMLRLLQGDVGSGKTVVAFLTMIDFIANKKQVVLMVPTSILASQHYEWIKRICENTGIIVESLTGKTKGKKRENILKKLEDGEIDILVGTHAVFQENVKFKNLSYVIIDEQHRFGVSQRLNLIEKAENVDVLVMTATPIPRTLSLTIYGDMEVSVIKEKPKNRKEIITTSLHCDNFFNLTERIKNMIRDGEKIYWICPMIDESENLEATPLFKRYEELKMFFKEEEIGFIHGKLKEDEKDKIMEEFSVKDGFKKILIATTVIEVGIDVPDATVIVIENPERFGLAQMHQLRGRVGRGDRQSYCILFFQKFSQNLKKRMEILKNNSDGFVIAEEDLKMRGSGEILGFKQSGFPDYRIANLGEHYELLIEAAKMARQIVNNKEMLNSEPIKDMLRLYGYGNIQLKENILN